MDFQTALIIMGLILIGCSTLGFTLVTVGKILLDYTMVKSREMTDDMLKDLDEQFKTPALYN